MYLSTPVRCITTRASTYRSHNRADRNLRLDCSSWWCRYGARVWSCLTPILYNRGFPGCQVCRYLWLVTVVYGLYTVVPQTAPDHISVYFMLLSSILFIWIALKTKECNVLIYLPMVWYNICHAYNYKIHKNELCYDRSKILFCFCNILVIIMCSVINCYSYGYGRK